MVVPVPKTLEPPPRGTGDVQNDFYFMLDWFYRAYQVVRQSVDYINAQIETGDIDFTDLPDPETATVASAQQTANDAFNLALQTKTTVGDTATLNLSIDSDFKITGDVIEAGIDHGSISGLGDDDHTIYALLLGRSGGQTIIGGTGAGEDLTLQSSSNATKGKMKFGTSAYDEVNNRLGVGTDAPTETLDVNNDTIRIRTSKTPATAGAAGVQGQWSWDDDFIYVCISANVWKRVGISTW